MKLSNDTAKAVSTKQFFIFTSMFTRDIRLDEWRPNHRPGGAA